MKAEVSRDGTIVAITIECTDSYAAILLYDQLCSELAAGKVQLTLVTTEKDTVTK